MKRQVAIKRLPKMRRESDRVVVLLKQLAHPQRLLILCNLVNGERSVGEIERVCGASQSAVSQFLKTMRQERLVDSRRDGKQVYYRIRDKRILELIDSLYQVFCK